MSSTKPLIVLIHGAWHWGGCFQKVADLLAEQGYPVATPDLAAHGYDPTPCSEVKTMDDYVRPVTDILQRAAEPVVLLGHSLGGATLTYVGERHPKKIRGLIYLAAYMCPPGLGVVDCAQFPENTNAEVLQAVDLSDRQRGSLLKLHEQALLRSVFYHDCSDHDVKVALANLVPVTPGPPSVCRSDATRENFGTLPRGYIECTADRAVPLALQRRFQKDLPGTKVRTLDASHSPFFSMPEPLTAAIAELIEEMSAADRPA